MWHWRHPHPDKLQMMTWFSTVLLIITLAALYRYGNSLPNEGTKRLFVASLAVKLIAGLALGLIYTFFYAGGDSWLYFSEAQKIDFLCQTEGVSVYPFLSGSEIASGIHQSLIFRNQPSALFFNKVVYLIYLFSWGNFWMISAYLALFSFLGFWIFYRCLVRNYRFAPLTLVFALFFWPSVVFWSSGLVKESLSTPLILITICCTIYLVKQSRYWVAYLLLFMFCTLLLFQIKYYYAAVLVPILVSWYLVALIKKYAKPVNQKNYLQGLLFLLILIVTTTLASRIHFNLRMDNVLQVMVDNYYLFEAKSSPDKMVQFRGLSPDISSLAYHAPNALFSGLFRPLIFEGGNLWSLLAGVENSILLLLALFQLVNFRKITNRHFLPLLSMIIYCGLLAALLTWSSPNFGTLVRYKVGFLPILLLLVLERNPAIGYLIAKMKPKRA